MNALFAALTRSELIAVIAVVAVIVVMTIIIIAVRVSRSEKKDGVSGAPSGSEKEIADKTETETNDAADKSADEKDEKSDEEQSTDDEQAEDEQDEQAATDELAEEEKASDEPVEQEEEESDEPAVQEPEAIDEPAAVEEAVEQEPVEEPVAEEPAEVAVEEAAAVAEQAATEQEPAETEELADAEQAAIDETYPEFIEKYLNELDDESRDAFENVVLRNGDELKTRIKLPVSQYADEKAFLADYFRSCSKFAKRMPIAVTEMLYKRNSEFTATDKDRSRAMRKMIAAYYSRRKDEDTLERCESLCKEDTEYYIETVGLRQKTLPPLKKLVVMCVAQNRFDDAVSWCDVAIGNDIIDAKGAGYEQRKDKILTKKEKFEAKQAKLAAKKNK